MPLKQQFLPLDIFKASNLVFVLFGAASPRSHRAGMQLRLAMGSPASDASLTGSSQKRQNPVPPTPALICMKPAGNFLCLEGWYFFPLSWFTINFLAGNTVSVIHWYIKHQEHRNQSVKKCILSSLFCLHEIYHPCVFWSICFLKNWTLKPLLQGLKLFLIVQWSQKKLFKCSVTTWRFFFLPPVHSNLVPNSYDARQWT